VAKFGFLEAPFCHSERSGGVFGNQQYRFLAILEMTVIQRFLKYPQHSKALSTVPAGSMK